MNIKGKMIKFSTGMKPEESYGKRDKISKAPMKMTKRKTIRFRLPKY